MADNKHSQYEQYHRCESMSKVQSLISGKWKILILWYISFYKMQRFNELQRRLNGITHSTLSKQLRELEEDGLVIKTNYPEVPPRVEYTLSELGESFIPVLKNMQSWSEEHL